MSLNSGNKETTWLIGNKVGQYILWCKRGRSVEQVHSNQTLLNLNNPLQRGNRDHSIGNIGVWSYSKHEKLPSSCYNSGCLGHTSRNYGKSEEINDGEERDLPFDEWLMASPMKR